VDARGTATFEANVTVTSRTRGVVFGEQTVHLLIEVPDGVR